MRQIILDTETTGLEVDQGHRIIEIGCLELINRRPTGKNLHKYLNPDREIDAGAVQVHGLTNSFLADKPLFHEIAEELRNYLTGAELVIHNAAFDVGFLNREFLRCGYDQPLAERCKITDTVAMARKLHPGQKVNLDALCKRYGVDNSGRDFHGALLDARLLADVYLAMTGGQSRLTLEQAGGTQGARHSRLLDQLRSQSAGLALPVPRASAEEIELHQARLKGLVKKAGQCFWMEDLPAAEAAKT
ncbi:MAG: DNA polymerase III subunit epsilon [Stagnimonas sp.]|nr:DNA polymerase III subunit epsilon [Stagnimonas sp.]